MDERTKGAVVAWIATNPGKDVEHVADHFGLDLMEAADLVDELLREGQLDFAETPGEGK